MLNAATLALILLRVTGLMQIVLGALFWTGNALPLISVHMRIGVVLVITLWVLALLAARAGVNLALAALALGWGAAVLILGLTQARLLPGDLHWLIQVLHLLAGLAAIGMGERLASHITSSNPAPDAAPGSRGVAR